MKLVYIGGQLLTRGQTSEQTNIYCHPVCDEPYYCFFFLAKFFQIYCFQNEFVVRPLLYNIFQSCQVYGSNHTLTPPPFFFYFYVHVQGNRVENSRWACFYKIMIQNGVAQGTLLIRIITSYFLAECAMIILFVLSRHCMSWYPWITRVRPTLITRVKQMCAMEVELIGLGNYLQFEV